MPDWNQLLQVLSSTVLTSQIENDVFCFVFKSPLKLKIFSSKTRIEFIKVLAFSNPWRESREANTTRVGELINSRVNMLSKQRAIFRRYDQHK